MVINFVCLNFTAHIIWGKKIYGNYTKGQTMRIDFTTDDFFVTDTFVIPRKVKLITEDSLPDESLEIDCNFRRGLNVLGCNDEWVAREYALNRQNRYSEYEEFKYRVHTAKINMLCLQLKERTHQKGSK